MKTKTKTKKAKTVQESYDLNGTRVDRDKAIIHDVLILGPQSRNGNEYLQPARQAAVKLFEGARVNLSHQKQLNPVTGKYEAITAVDYPRRFGKVFGVRDTDSGTRGNLKCLKSHPFTETLMEAAEEMPEAFSLSPVFDVIGADDNPRKIVAIEKVWSVDVVTDGGTTRTLFEDADGEEPKEDAGLHEEEVEELEEIDIELRHLIEQVTTELVDFHHDHKDADQAGKRIGAHVKHHAKMHLGSKEEEAEEEEPKEESPEQKEHEEEYRLLKAEKASRRICEERQVEATKDLLDILTALPDDDARDKHVVFIKRQSIVSTKPSDPRPEPRNGDDWVSTLRRK